MNCDREEMEEDDADLFNEEAHSKSLEELKKNTASFRIKSTPGTPTTQTTPRAIHSENIQKIKHSNKKQQASQGSFQAALQDLQKGPNDRTGL